MNSSNGRPTPSVAMQPIGWRRLRLNEVAERVSVGLAMSVTEYYCESGVPLIRNQNICDGWFDDTDIIYVQPRFAESQPGKTIRAGDVLTVRTGANIGQTCVVPSRFAGSQSFTTLITTTKQRDLVPEYLSFHLQSPIGRSEIERLQVGGGKGNLNAGHLEGYRIDVPPVEEQRCICQILGLWDRALFTLPKLIAAKLRFKQGLMQQLLTGKRRFPRFKQGWRHVRIGEVAQEVSDRNPDGDSIPVLSCTKYDGLVDSLEYFGKRVFSENTDNYKVVRRNDFAYATNHIEEGSIGLLRHADAGLVSPMYTVFRTNGEVDPEYLYRVLKTETLRQVFASFTSASVNRRGSLRWKQFSTIPLELPSIDEQSYINNAMAAFDRELELLRKQLAALKQQKRGLMQKLLTGEVRVPFTGGKTND